MVVIEALVQLLPVVPFAALLALRYRWWWLMEIAALMVLPIALVSHMPYMLFWLCAFVLLAAALALRWQVRIAGWIGLILAAGAIWGIVVAGYTLGPRDLQYSWILFVAPLVGFLALGWNRPPWQTPA